MNQVPERVTTYRVYNGGSELIGTASAQLPSLEYLTESVKGAGILGEIDSPTYGQVGSLTMTLNFRTVQKSAINLAQPKAHPIELRSVQQIFNPVTGEYKMQPVRIVTRAIPKKVDLGKLEVGATSDASNEFEITYYKVFIDEVKVIEIDKYNYVFFINGIDYGQEIRKALG